MKYIKLVSFSKVRAFTGCCLLAGIMAYLCASLTAFVATMTLAYIKERVDEADGECFCWRDLLAACLGSGLGVVFAGAARHGLLGL